MSEKPNSIDRVPNGIDRRCDDCGRSFKGKAWQDYCAPCHAEPERNSPLNKRWACFTCNTTFVAGKIRSGPAGWQCPNCKSTDIGPAEGAREIAAYDGHIPERKQ